MERSARAWGSVIGLAATALLAGLFESLVYGISVYDPFSFIAGPIALAIVALAGGWIPAWNATRSDPEGALPSE